MKKTKLTIHLQFVCLITLAFFLTGCATVKTAPGTGFLSSYSTLTPTEDDEDLLLDESQQAAVYSQVLVAPVIVYLHEDAKAAAFDPAQMKELTDFFYEELTASLKEGNYKIVEEAGPNTLLIKTAITDVVPNKVHFNLHWSTTATGMGVGGASFEAEFVDAQTNERVFAVMDTRKGKRLKYTKGLSKWGHTKDVFKQWSKMLTEKLDGYYQQL